MYCEDLVHQVFNSCLSNMYYDLWRSGSPSGQFLLVKYCEDLVHQVVNSYLSNIVKIWSTKWSILTCLILWRSSPPRGQFLLVQYVLWRSGSPSVQFLLVKYCEDLVHQVVNDDFSHPQGPVDVSHLKEEMMTNHLLFFKHIFKNHLNLRYLTIGNKDETDL